VTESPLTRLVRALLLAAAALVLLGLVVVAAGGYRLSGSSSSQPSPYAVDTILTIVLAFYAIGAVALIGGAFWAGLEVRRNPGPVRPRQRSVSRVLVMLGALSLLLVAAERFNWRNLHRDHGQQAAQTSTLPAGGAAKSNQRPKAKHEAQFRLVPFLAVLGAAAAAFGAFYVAEGRRRRRLPREPLVADELSEVLDETLEDLRAERDPRRAVIAAYARMERVLAAHGVPRRRSEAPHEYLERVLTELTGGGRAARRLTTLFERARFSPHAIDEGLRAEALDALTALRIELEATP
jgi:Domain of unknown function (DUF4129)